MNTDNNHKWITEPWKCLDCGYEKGDKPNSYVVTFIIDIHMPEPFGGFRREFEKEFKEVPNSKLLIEFIDTILSE